MKFKNNRDKELFFSLHLALIMIYADVSLYAKDTYGIDLVITETITTPDEDLALNRVSDSHQKGISLDFRTKDIPDNIIEDIVDYINNNPAYEEYHYLSGSGVYRLAYHHNNGNGDHCHLQIHQRFSNK